MRGPQPGLLFRQRTLGRVELRLEGLGVHLEHDLAELDDAAFGVEPLVQETVHTRTNLHLLRTGGAADKFEGDRPVAGLDLDDSHLGRRRRWRFRFSAAGEEQGEGSQNSDTLQCFT